LVKFDFHRISENSLESFIINVYRETNRSGFIKAFSSSPEMLQNSFQKIERMMRILFVKKLYLWPRFRMDVKEAIECRTAQNLQISEYNIPLSANMKRIQNALFVSINTCLQELRKASPTHFENNHNGNGNKNNDPWSFENSLFQEFDQQLRFKLDSDWHRLSYRTKQIVSDLGTLRKLLDYLIRYDAFSFYYLLLKLQQQSHEQVSPSLW
jgi:DNA excision repair protein ERCC-4